MNTDLDISVINGHDLSDTQIEEIMALFDQSYRQANHGYFLKSFDVMRWIALARDETGLAGFAVGDAVMASVPRMAEEQVVAMAGIACIDARHRRGGLFGRLALASIMESGLLEEDTRHLFCGRMAHAASYRAMTRAGRNVVPLAGQEMSEWHSEVIECVAALYGVDVDPLTGRVIGKGTPIGYPLLDYDATPEEEAVFAPVDRDNGDSLLTIAWRPEPPEGWLPN